MKHGIIREENITCVVCASSKSLVYEGPFYTEEEPGKICPWCIADGSAADEYDGEFVDAGSVEDVEDDDKIQELTRRTPSYTGWQQEQWPAHCEDFCAFAGYADWKDISRWQSELGEDLEQIMNDYDYDENELKESLRSGGDMQAYLFQCLHCGQHRLLIDTN